MSTITTTELQAQINNCSSELKQHILSLQEDSRHLKRVVSVSSQDDLVFMAVIIKGIKAYAATPENKRNGQLYDHYTDLVKTMTYGQSRFKNNLELN